MLARASQYAVIEFSTLLTPRQLNSPLRCSVVQAFVDNLQHALEAEGFSAPSAAGQPVVGLPGHDGSHSYKLPLCFTVDDAAKLAHGWHDGVFSSGEFRADWYCRGGSRALRFLVVGLPVHTDLEELRGMLASLATVDQVHVSPAYLDVGLPRRDAAHATICFSTRGFPRFVPLADASGGITGRLRLDLQASRQPCPLARNSQGTASSSPLPSTTGGAAASPIFTAPIFLAFGGGARGGGDGCHRLHGGGPAGPVCFR